MKREKFMDFEKLGIKNIDIRSVRMKALDGEDTIAAAVRCVPGEGQSVDANLFGLTFRQHMLAEAIIEVDGKRCIGPCLDSIRWSLRTKEFIGDIYDLLNGVQKDEREVFQKALAANDDGPTS